MITLCSIRHLSKVPLALRDVEDAEDHEFVVVGNLDAVHDHVRQVRHDNFTGTRFVAVAAKMWQRAASIRTISTIRNRTRLAASALCP